MDHRFKNQGENAVDNYDDLKQCECIFDKKKMDEILESGVKSEKSKIVLLIFIACSIFSLIWEFGIIMKRIVFLKYA